VTTNSSISVAASRRLIKIMFTPDESGKTERLGRELWVGTCGCR
jgi:hypothetical protein